MKGINGKNYDTNKYQYKQMCVLTIPEGEILKDYLEQYGCENISQLAKKIVHKKLVLIDYDVFEMLKKIPDEVMQKEIKQKRLNSILQEFNYNNIEELLYDIKLIYNI